LIARHTDQRIQQTIDGQANTSSISTQAIDHASQVHESAVQSQDLENLPLPARSFANIAYLAPGTDRRSPRRLAQLLVEPLRLTVGVTHRSRNSPVSKPHIAIC